jgi:hypothetical protein
MFYTMIFSVCFDYENTLSILHHIVNMNPLRGKNNRFGLRDAMWHAARERDIYACTKVAEFYSIEDRVFRLLMMTLHSLVAVVFSLIGACHYHYY